MSTNVGQQPPDEREELPAPGPNVLQIGWRFKWLIALGGAIGLMVGYLYGAQLPPSFASSAKVMVVKKRPDIGLAFEGRVSPVEDYLSTHQELIRSPIIVDEAVKKLKQNYPATLKNLAEDGSPAAGIIGNLKIGRVAGENSRIGTSILTLSYSGPVSEDCGVIISAVVESYIYFLDKKFKDVSKDMKDWVLEAKDGLEKELQVKRSELHELRGKHPELRKSKDGVTVVNDQITQIEAKRSARMIFLVELAAKLTRFQQALKENRPREELLALAAADASSKASTQSLGDNPLFKLQREEALLLQDYGPDHPKVKAVRREMELFAQELRELHNKPRLDEAGKGGDPVQSYLLALKSELDYGEAQQKALTNLLEEVRKTDVAFMQFEQKEEDVRKEIERKTLLYESIAKKLTEMNLLSAQGDFEAVTIAPPGPGGKVGPNEFRIQITGALLGMLAGCGLAYLAFLTDQSFRTPEEIRRRLGLPLIGHIPSFAARGEAQPTADGPPLDRSMVTYYRSKSRESEAYRGVRTALFYSTRGEGHKIIQVTSPDMGDGKTTLAANLAISVAQSEKKVILVDADMRRPRVHKIFGLSNDRGLSTVLTGEVELKDAIQESGVPGLHLLTTGQTPPNPAELLSLPRFEQVLELLRQQYEFVVVDTPPLLAVTDPCAVAPHVDGVLLTMRLSKRARLHSLRAKEILSTLGVAVIGIVVNGVGRQSAAGYGYKTYGYGYDYGYGYSYGYGYGGSYDNDSYYASDGAAPEAAAVVPVQGAAERTDANGQAESAAPRARRRERRRSSSSKKGFFDWLFNR